MNGGALGKSSEPRCFASQQNVHASVNTNSYVYMPWQGSQDLSAQEADRLCRSRTGAGLALFCNDVDVQAAVKVSPADAIGLIAHNRSGHWSQSKNESSSRDICLPGTSFGPWATGAAETKTAKTASGDCAVLSSSTSTFIETPCTGTTTSSGYFCGDSLTAM